MAAPAAAAPLPLCGHYQMKLVNIKYGLYGNSLNCQGWDATVHELNSQPLSEQRI